jgi:hypothetical protein
LDRLTCLRLVLSPSIQTAATGCGTQKEDRDEAFESTHDLISRECCARTLVKDALPFGKFHFRNRESKNVKSIRPDGSIFGE